MSTIADLVIRLKANTADAEKSIGSFSGKVSRGFGKALLPAVGVLGGLGVAAKKAADTAVNLGESQNAVNVVFGEGAKTINKFARVADKEAGLSMRALNELVTPVGASLQNFGFSAKDAARESINLAKRSADMASVFNVDVSEALLAIQAGLRGEADPLERFGVGLSAAAVEAKALSMGLGKTTVDMGLVKDAQLKLSLAQDKYSSAMRKGGKDSEETKRALLGMHSAQRTLTKTLEGGKSELSANAKMQARLALVMDQTNKLQGDFVNTSGSAANAARINAAAQENLKAKLGSAVVPALQAYHKVLGTVTGFMSEHTTAVKVAVGVVGGLAAAVILVNAATMVWVAGQKVAMVATKLWAAAQWLLNAAMAANPIGLVVFALVALATALVVAWKKSETFRAIVIGAWNGIKSVVGAVVGWFTTAIPAAWEKVKSATSSAWNFVLGFFRKWWPLLLGVFFGPLGIVVGLIVKNWDTIKEKTSAAWNAVKSAVSGAIDAVVNFVRSLPGRAVSALSALGGRLADAARAAWEKFDAAVDTAVEKFLGFLRALPGTVLELARKTGLAIVDGVINGVSSLGSALKDKVEGALKGALSKLNPFSPVEHGGEKYIGKPLADGAIRGWILGSAALPAALSDTVRKAVEVARGAIEAQRGALSGTWSALASDALAAFDAIRGKIKTKSEKLLDDLRLERQLGTMADSVADAQGGLRSAKAAEAGLRQEDDEDPAAFAARQAAARQAVLDAQKQLDDALWAKREFGLQRKAEQERLERDASTALKRRHFESSLVELQAQLAKEGAAHGKSQKSILKMLDQFGVDYKSSGLALGKMFARGLHESLDGVEKAAKALAKTVAKYLPHSPAEKGPLSEPPGWEAYLTGGLPGAVGAANRHLGGFSPVVPGTGRLAGAVAGGGAGAGRALTVNVNGAHVQPLDEGRLLDLLRRAEALTA